jgi:hypothetical protein
MALITLRMTRAEIAQMLDYLHDRDYGRESGRLLAQILPNSTIVTKVKSDWWKRRNKLLAASTVSEGGR